MRVLMTADTVGGVWTYALSLAQALRPRGVQFALATMGAPPSKSQRAQVARLPNVQLYESTYKLEWMAKPWDDVARAGEWLLDIEKTFEPDVVHLNGYAHGNVPFEAKRLIVAHSCVLSWWEAVKNESAPVDWDAYRKHVMRGLAAADHIVAPSEAMLNVIRRHYLPTLDGEVIYNGCEPSHYNAWREKSEYIFSAGRVWDEAKNISTIDCAAKHLSWRVGVAGDVTHPDGHEAAMQHTSLLGTLHPAAMRTQLSRAAVYASPARYEPFGLSILEAALSGCALVLGDIESLREIWDDAALFVSPDDADALHEALNGLIHNRATRDALAARAFARAQRYSMTAMADAYDRVYRALALPVSRPLHASLGGLIA